MKIKWNFWNRKVHYWGAIVCAVPVIIIICTGIVLLLKKESTWIQPSTLNGKPNELTLTFDQILESSKSIQVAEIRNWDDVNRLDVRPGKGVVKVQSNNSWEIQIDSSSGEVMQVAYRRSDLIESIHDGSFFHENVKLMIFLPSALVLLVLWLTGIYLFVLPLWKKRKRKIRFGNENKIKTLQA